MTLAKRYKKLAFGGTPEDMMQGLGTGAGAASGIIDALNPADKYGQSSGVGNVASSALKFGAMGANFGPIGAGVGAAVGIVSGILGNKKQRDRANFLKGQEYVNNMRMTQEQAAARVSADPTIVNGNLQAGYYAAGGSLIPSTNNVASQQVQGGTITPLNSSAAEINGPSHADGGVQIPSKEAEVEGGETTNGDYVYSEQLGFAKLHRPIATAIGKIEKKALSPERVTSLKLLKGKENQLKLSQEYLKKQLGLN
jgi:hypothetical protein